jgi:hypothetical protein
MCRILVIHYAFEGHAIEIRVSVGNTVPLVVCPMEQQSPFRNGACYNYMSDSSQNRSKMRNASNILLGTPQEKWPHGTTRRR